MTESSTQRYRLHFSLCTPTAFHDQPDRFASPLTFHHLFDLPESLAGIGAATEPTTRQLSVKLGGLRRANRNHSSAAAAEALDPRLGTITIQSLPVTQMPTAESSTSAAGLSASSQPWRSQFTKSSSFLVEPEHGETATEVSFGIVHLFRDTDAGAGTGQLPGRTEPLVALEDETATILAILGLPSHMTAADFLAWVEPALESIEKIRMIREGSSFHRVTVLIKFRDPVDAEEFYKQYCGQTLPFVATRAVHPQETPSSPSSASTATMPTATSASSISSSSSTTAKRQLAHIVYITQVTVSAGPQLPYSYPQLANSDSWPLAPAALSVEPSSGSQSKTDRTNEALDVSTTSTTPAARLALSLANELPTCPVCLERMDSSITGIMTVSCQHSFHCECLSRWGDARCPVCRYSQNRSTKKGPASLLASARRNLHTLATQHDPSISLDADVSLDDEEEEDAVDDEAATQCTVCGTTDDLWVCLICATVGCGRYKKGCAKRHFVESGHLYSLEVETSRVWDYVQDGYIHRLIQNRADGKLVELPWGTSSTANSTPSRSARHRRHHRRHHRRRHHHRGHETPTEGQTATAGTSSALLHARDNDSSDYTSGSDDDEEEEVEGDEGEYSKEGDKMGGKLGSSDAKLEAISLEYQYLLLSQLESQRSYYEDQVRRVQSELDEARSSKQSSTVLAAKEAELEAQRASWSEKVARSEAREKVIAAKCERAQEASSKLTRDLEAERALSKGLLERLKQSQERARQRDAEALELKRKCQDQEEQLRDLMFALEAQHKIQAATEEHQRQQLQHDGGGNDDGQQQGNALHEAKGGDLIIKGGSSNTRRPQRPLQQDAPRSSNGSLDTGDAGDEKAAAAVQKKKKKQKRKKKKGKTAQGSAATTADGLREEEAPDDNGDGGVDSSDESEEGEEGSEGRVGRVVS